MKTTFYDKFGKINVPRRMAAVTAIAMLCAALFLPGCGGGGGGGGTVTPPVTCDSHDSKVCYNGDVYWYDSCNVREEVYQTCASNEQCTNAACETIVYTWEYTFGGASGDAAEDIKQTSDGGYIVVGDTKSSGSGQSDAYIIKLTAAGAKSWEQVYGGASFDAAKSVVQTTDGGYAVAGYTYSQGSGLADFWVMKLNSSGVQQWEQTYGGAMADVAESIIQTTDGGFAVAGYTYSQGSGLGDVWVLKLTSSGAQSWSRVTGGTGNEVAREIIQTSDGGYAVAGFTTSYGTGQEDFYVVKLTSTGAVSWSQTYGGSGVDKAESIKQTADGGYIIAGAQENGGSGESDAWLVKTTSTGSQSWQQLHGGAQYESFYSIVETTDGGFIAAGYTSSTGAGSEDAWLMKLGSGGGETWSQTFGGASADVAYSVIATSDGGYAIAGYTASSGSGLEDFYVVKLNSSGQQ